MSDLAVLPQQHNQTAPQKGRSRGFDPESAAFAFSFQQLLTAAATTPQPHHLPQSIELLGSAAPAAETTPPAADDAGEPYSERRDRAEDRHDEGLGATDDTRPSRDGYEDSYEEEAPVRAAGDAAANSGDYRDADPAPAASDTDPTTADAAATDGTAAVALASADWGRQSANPAAGVGADGRGAAASAAPPQHGIPATPPPQAGNAAETVAAVATAGAAGSAAGTSQLTASVTKEADVLVSQPGATLAAQASVAAETTQVQNVRGSADAGQATATQAAAAGMTLTAEVLPAQARPTSATGAGAVNGKAAAAARNGQAQPQAAGVDQGQAQALANGQAAAMMTAEAIVPPAATANTGSTASGEAGAIRSAGSASVEATGVGGGGGQLAPGATQAGKTQAPPSRPASFQQQMVSDQVNVHIKKAVQEGADRIDIKLRPEALGRVEVRLEVGQDGRVVASVTADQRHTLDLLRADARSLERALQEAGLQADSGSLNFNLRGEGGGSGQHSPGGRPGMAGAGFAGSEDAAAATPATAPSTAYLQGGRTDGIDIRA